MIPHLPVASAFVAGVDPDTKHPSVAIAEVATRKLVRVAHCQSPWYHPSEYLTCYGAHGVIEDQPAVFPGIRTRDIIRLSQAAGAVATWFESREWVMEMTWKRGISKKVYHEWLRGQLSADELTLLRDIKQRTIIVEVMDAVGIALWRLGRSP